VRIVGPRLFARDTRIAAPRQPGVSGLRLLTVGRIRPHKKIEHLLELFAEFLKITPDADLTIVGLPGSKAYADYLSWVQQHFQLPEDKVHWRGSVGEDELAEEYGRASVYLSMSEDEGFGLPLLEAMVHGVPVVAFDI